MKNIILKIKHFVTDTWYGMLIFSAIILLWSFDIFEGTIIGKILNFILGIAGLGIFGLYALVFIFLIYFTIKSYFKRKVQEEIQKTLAKEKYEQYLSEQKKKGIDKNE